MSVVGIDFGTTNSVVAVNGPSGVEALPIDRPPADWATLGFDRVMPTIFGVSPDGEPVFGWEAKVGTDEKIEAVKRLFREEEVVQIGDRTFMVEEVASLLFSHMKKRAQESGVDPRKCVVTVPANSRGLARFRTKVCAGMAGMEVLALINEPTAAAMAHSAKSSFDQRLMVVDWGGGTLDVTVLQASEGVFIEQASKGIQQLGGLDFDARLAKSILESVPDSDRWSGIMRAEFRLAVERAKILLSSQEFTTVPLPNGEVRRVTRQDFDDSARALVERVRQPIEQCLRDINGQPADIDALILVGGTCNIPLVRNFIGGLLETAPAEGVNPMTAIAEGAAIAASIMSGELEDNDFFVGTEHALGTFVVGSSGGLEFSTLIARNHKLPAKATESFVPVYDDQVSVVVKVVEGDPEVPTDHEDNVVLREIEFALPDRATRGEKAVEMTYTYDLDGILHVSVVDEMTGNTLVQEDVSFGVGTDRRGLVTLANRVRSTMDTHQVGDDYRSDRNDSDSDGVPPDLAVLLQRAKTKVIPFVDAAEAAEIRKLVGQIEHSSGSAQRQAGAALEDALAPYSYLF